MKLRWILVLALVFGVAQSIWALSADEVLQKVEDRYIGKTSKSDSNMVLARKDRKPMTRKMLILRKKADADNKDNFILFTAPPDMKDTKYLVNEVKRTREKWIYLSAMKKKRRIMSETDYNQAFVASDFTYEDMDDIHASDYAASDLKEEKLDGEDVYSIDCKKKDGKTDYSHSVLKVSKDKFVVLKALLYDKADPAKQVKEMVAKNLEKVQDIWTPKSVTMTDLRNSNSTTLEVNKIEYDVKIDEGNLQAGNLEK